MRKLRRNWSLTKNDISKSLSRMTKKKSRIDLRDNLNKDQSNNKRNSSPDTNQILVENVENNETKSQPMKDLLTKFRRSISLSAESATELTSNLSSTKPKSTFYLTEIDIDEPITDEKIRKDTSRDSGVSSLSPIQRNSRIVRPQSPPPPAPVAKRATSWYSEVGLFKNNLPKRPNTFWYAEVGLYQPGSTPSTSSAENSGSNWVKSSQDFADSEEYYNLKNQDYNQSVKSFSSGEIAPDIQLRLQDEPLYQFYDAAVLEVVRIIRF